MNGAENKSTIKQAEVTDIHDDHLPSCCCCVARAYCCWVRTAIGC